MGWAYPKGSGKGKTYAKASGKGKTCKGKEVHGDDEYDDDGDGDGGGYDVNENADDTDGDVDIGDEYNGLLTTTNTDARMMRAEAC